MSEQTLKFGDIVVNKRKFHVPKQAIALNLVNTNKIVLANSNTVMMAIYMMMM